MAQQQRPYDGMAFPATTAPPPVIRQWRSHDEAHTQAEWVAVAPSYRSDPYGGGGGGAFPPGSAHPYEEMPVRRRLLPPDPTPPWQQAYPRGAWRPPAEDDEALWRRFDADDRAGEVLSTTTREAVGPPYVDLQSEPVRTGRPHHHHVPGPLPGRGPPPPPLAAAGEWTTTSWPAPSLAPPLAPPALSSGGSFPPEEPQPAPPPPPRWATPEDAYADHHLGAARGRPPPRPHQLKQQMVPRRVGPRPPDGAPTFTTLPTTVPRRRRPAVVERAGGGGRGALFFPGDDDASANASAASASASANASTASADADASPPTAKRRRGDRVLDEVVDVVSDPARPPPPPATFWMPDPKFPDAPAERLFKCWACDRWLHTWYFTICQVARDRPRPYFVGCTQRRDEGFDALARIYDAGAWPRCNACVARTHRNERSRKNFWVDDDCFTRSPHDKKKQTPTDVTRRGLIDFV